MDTGIKMPNVKYLVVDVDASTGEAIEREANADELKAIKELDKLAKATADDQKAQEAAKESALAKLAKLGLTPEEIAAL